MQPSEPGFLAVNGLGGPMKLQHMLQHQIGEFLCSRGFPAGDKMPHLGQSIDNSQDAIKAIGLK
jgi:hypothetical protein